jgi:hypothetical protein
LLPCADRLAAASAAAIELVALLVLCERHDAVIVGDSVAQRRDVAHELGANGGTRRSR